MPRHDWGRYARVLLVTIGVQAAATVLLVAIANPYGNLPPIAFKQHVIMDTNQRYQYPAVVRSERFDSIVVGTSTARLLRPAALEGVFGGKFANLAMDDATAWEEYRLATLFAHTVPQPQTLVVALDHVWCRANAGSRMVTARGFPEWMFDDDPWNDISSMLNKRTVEISVRRLAHAAGLLKARIAFDGYEVFVPPDDQYDAEKARRKLERRSARRLVAPSEPAFEASTDSTAFPALVWLEAILKQPWSRIVLIVTPVHVSAMPLAGQPDGVREKACKARLQSIARRYNVALVDFRIESDITARAENFWDPLHHRVAIAERIVDGLGNALRSKAERDPGGDWQALSVGAATAAFEP